MPSLRVVIITQGLSPIVVPLVETQAVVGIVEARPRRKKKDAQRLVLNSMRSLKRWFRRIWPKTLKRYCAKKLIPYWYMSDGCSEALEQWIRNLNPDLICVYSMSELLRENIFQIPRFGTINLHPSLLPKYRGPNPYFWIMLNEEKVNGPTIHYIDKGEDTGDILAQEAFTLSEGMTVSELQSESVTLGRQLMLRVIDELSNGSTISTTQPQRSPTARARRVKPHEYHQLVQWEEWSVNRIKRLFDSGVLSLADVFPDEAALRWREWKSVQITTSEHGSHPSGTVLLQSRICTLYCIDGAIKFSGYVRPKRVIQMLIGALT